MANDLEREDLKVGSALRAMLPMLHAASVAARAYKRLIYEENSADFPFEDRMVELGVVTNYSSMLCAGHLYLVASIISLLSDLENNAKIEEDHEAQRPQA